MNSKVHIKSKVKEGRNSLPSFLTNKEIISKEEQQGTTHIIEPELIEGWLESLGVIETAVGGGHAQGNVEHEYKDFLIGFSWDVWFSEGIDQKRVYIHFIWVGEKEFSLSEITDLQFNEIEQGITMRLQ